MKNLKRQWKFIVVLIAGAVGLISQFALHSKSLFSIGNLQFPVHAIIIDIKMQNNYRHHRNNNGH